MFAGSFQGITQTVPLAIYDRFATDFTAALALSAVLVAVSAAILLAVKLVGGARRCCALEARTRLGGLELDVGFEVPAGECLALAGTVGAGKTSVLRVVAGLLRPGGRARRLRRGGVARHGAPGSTCPPSGAAAATCSRSTRCSAT